MRQAEQGNLLKAKDFAIADKRNFTSNETVMLHVLIFIGLAIILVSMTATTRKAPTNDQRSDNARMA